MHTTVTINLDGRAFYIDEDAYRTLKSYLERIEKGLGNDTDRKEVMRDIEARIAELFDDTRRRKHVEVVSIDTVRAVMEQLGRPEDFQETAEDNPPVGNTQPLYRRRLYRDTERPILGGVCAGLGYWAGIDAVWVRIIFILCLMLWGLTLPAYLVLWLVMPAAETAAQRLEMRGEAPTAENIEREVARPKYTAEDRGCVVNTLITLLKAFVWLVGGLIIFVLALALFVVLIVALTAPVALWDMDIEMPFALSLLLNRLRIVTIGLLLLAPVVWSITALVRRFVYKEHLSRRRIWAGVILFLAAAVGVIALGVAGCV